MSWEIKTGKWLEVGPTSLVYAVQEKMGLQCGKLPSDLLHMYYIHSKANMHPHSHMHIHVYILYKYNTYYNIYTHTQTFKLNKKFVATTKVVCDRP